MPKPKVDNKANLSKNRKKFVQIFKRKVSGTEAPVLSYPEMRKLFTNNRRVLEVTKKYFFGDFLADLAEFGLLKVFHFEFPHESVTRYAHPDTSLYTIVGSFYQKAYFSHFSAIYLHQLTEQIPKTLYLNLEQKPKPGSVSRSNLLQANIDKAFSKPQRSTNNLCVFEDHTIVRLNGKATNNEGVEQVALNDQEYVRVTGLERTLIDIAVRPHYAGGVQHVLSAFVRAKELDVSINRLSATLKKLGYIYPYHQVIGFYLEKAGYSDHQIGMMDKLAKDHDFYLDYELHNPAYSKRWRLFVPQGF